MKKQIAKFPASFRVQVKAAPFPSGMAKTGIALGISAMLMPMAHAQETEMKPITVVERHFDHNPYAEPDAPYKAKKSGDDRRTRPLAETPATIQVMTKTQIEDSGFTDLRDILDAQPGITLGTGENGNAFGDRYIIRGYEARSDVFVDGLRDPGMTVRESFAVEQVEVSKGPNSSFAGRGTVGGAINAITKQATVDYDFTKLSAGLGTDSYQRFTVDANHVVNDNVAFRANVLYGYQGVPDRDPADRERKGLALSGLFKINDRLDVVLDYYGLRAKDKPDLGGYLTGTGNNRVPASNVPVYAQDQDFLTSDVDAFTARVKFKIADNVRFSNSTRFGKSDNAYVTTGMASGASQRFNGAGTVVTAGSSMYTTSGGAYYPGLNRTLSTHNGWQEVEYFANQSNLHWDTVIGGMRHEFIFGLEYTDHKVLNGVYNIANASNCQTIASSPMDSNSSLPGVQPHTPPRYQIANAFCAYQADGVTPTDNLNSGMNRQINKGGWDQDWQAKTISASVMDTVDLTDKWTVFGGLRYDRSTISLRTQNTSTGALTGDYGYTKGMWNGHLGVTWKFLPYANVYASWASAQDINGGESDVGTSAGYGGMVQYRGSVDAKPEKTENIELGTKWNLMDGKLLATAAVFQTTKSDVMEGADYASVGTFNTGKNRVQGIEFGLAGNVTDKLSAFAGVAFMESEVLDSVTAANVGKTLSNFADTTASVQLRYQATPTFGFGAAAKYESKKYGGQPDTAAGFDATTGIYSQPVPAYTVVDVFADYRLSKNAKLRLNVGNVFDKDYYLAVYRSGSFLYKGDARNARLTLNYDF